MTASFVRGRRAVRARVPEPGRRVDGARLAKAFAFALALVSCGGGEYAATRFGGPLAPGSTGAAVPAPVFDPATIDAKVVMEYLSRTSPYGAWSWWPGHEGVRPGKAPHGRYHAIFVSPGFAEALPLDPPIAPPGSIVVKESFDADRRFTRLDVMVKVPGYAPEAGDWFWAEYDADGAILVEGRVGMCVNCHAAFKRNDWLVVRGLGD